MRTPYFVHENRRTESDIEMEQENLRNQMDSLIKEQKDSKKYDEMDKSASDAAYALRSTYLAYVEAGFTEDQAFELIAIQVGKAAQS